MRTSEASSHATTAMERTLARLPLAFAVAVILATAVADAQQAVGAACRGGAGECKIIHDCPEAREALRRREKPEVCFYQGFTPVVCCSKAPTPTSTAATPLDRPGGAPGGGSGNGQTSERVAARMCTKYGEAVYRYDKTFHLPPQTVRVDQCATKGKPFITGGVEAIANEFPHMALLGYGSEEQPSWECGGSLISERFVLTAAHCISTKLGSPKVARLGELIISSSDERQRHEDFPVAQSIPHPEHKSGVRYNDIGLLRLARDVTFSASMRPACLQLLTDFGAKAAIASGWGLTDWISPVISDKLMKTSLPIQKTELCSNAYKTLSTTFQLRRGILEESMICAGGKGGNDTCRGDSGGPLQLQLSTPYCMYSIVGVTSFGPNSCGKTSSPAVYTRVSHFMTWIETIVWPSQ